MAVAIMDAALPDILIHNHQGTLNAIHTENRGDYFPLGDFSSLLNVSC